MFDLDYKRFHIHIEPKDLASNEELLLAITSKDYKLGFCLYRKCNKETITTTRKQVSIFGIKEDKQEYDTYHMKETLNDLIGEGKIIIDMLCKMEDMMMDKATNKLMDMKIF